MSNPNIEQIERAVVTSLQKHWLLSLVEGIVLSILGLAALVIQRMLAVDILFGWLFLISGITGLITTFWVQQAPGFGWSLLSAILGIVAGMLLLLSPNGVLSLSLFVGAKLRCISWRTGM